MTEYDKYQEERLKEIIKMAYKLDWIYPIDQPNHRKFSYPLMQLSEVEKCIIAMYDDSQLERMRNWTKDIPDDYISKHMPERRTN